MAIDALAKGWAKAVGVDRKQFDMFFDKMLDGFAYHRIVVDKACKPVDYVFLEVNHAFEKMTGLKREQILGKKVTEVLLGIEKDPADWIGVYGKVALTGEPIQFENYNEALCKWFKVVAYCPEKGYFAVLFEDITERKKAEETLKESEERFSKAFFGNQQAMAISELDGKLIEVNTKFEVLFGVERQKLIGHFMSDFLKYGDRNKRERTLKLLKEGKEVEDEQSYLLQTGRKIDTTYFVQVINVNGEKRLFGMWQDITESKKSEQALKESEERFRFALKNSPVSVAAQDCDLKYVWAFNQRTARPEQINGKLDSEIFTAEEAQHLGEVKSRVIKEDIEVREQSWYIRPSGRIFLDVTWTPLHNDRGKVIGVASATVDLTSSKLAEMALKESEAHYHLLFDNIDEAFMLLEVIKNQKGEACDFRYLELNSAYEKQTGVRTSDIVGKTTSEVYPGSEDYWLRVFGEVEKTGKPISFENFSKPLDRYYQTYAFPFAKNQIGVIARDITERKKSEETLKESEQLYHTVFDNSQDGFQLIELVYDKNGKPIDHKFLKVNHAYEKIIGVKAEDILDKTAKYISPNQEPHWLDVPDRVAKTGISEHVELYNKDINKTLDCYYFLYSKNVVGTLFRDITERKNMEKQLQNSERLAAIGATAGMVGHDIRNPLQAITGDVYLAKTELASLPESEEKTNTIESLQEIEKNIEYINKIVQDLQDFARPLNPKAEEADLKLIITKLFEKNNWPDNIELSVKVENSDKKISTDSNYINRIMYNLITNAVQAMPNGGKLTVHAFQDPKDLVMIVKDTGVGIPKDVQAKMFTLMFTTKAKGQGFGLPVVKRMTESLGGTVTFESEVGKGTTFTVRLPLNK